MFIVTIITIDFYLLKESSSVNLQKELNSVSAIIKQYYISGDLASLRNFLDSWGKLNSIGGSLTDTNNNVIWQSNLTTEDYITIKSDLTFMNQVKIGTMSLAQDLTEIKKNKIEQYLKLSLYLFFITISFVLIFYFVTKLSLKPIREIFYTLKQEANAIGFNFKKVDSDELTTIKIWFQELSAAWTIEKKNSTDAAKAITFSQIASQVAHDIRSPLSALNMITSSLDEVSEDKRAIIRSSIQRINDIANDLLKKGKSPQTDVTTESTQQTKTDSLLTSVAESILSEKRVQFKNKIKIQISLDTSKAYGIFVAINESEFKRVLSNIINNAVEAIGDNVGVVNLTLEKQNNSAIIKITDNGPGIPENILEKLGKESVTFGKENSDSGSGIGVLHAKNTIESYGGSFSIQSKQGKGTTITLSLPISTTPVWFLETLNINQEETLIICDDDSSIHSLWKERFSSYPNHKILNFSTLKEIENWLSISENLNSSFKLLIDFEFSNESGDGLSLISKYNLNEKSILITSHFEESNIISKCTDDNIKQIPKNLAGIVPIKIQTESEKIDALILDDEELQERLWQFAAIQRGKKIVFLKTPDQLFQKLSTINTDTPIYIDSKLADGRKGEDIALHLNKLGYTNLYLTTGYSAEDFKHLSFLKGVIGKTPKFE
jgi:signal transduction histidine kinase